MEFSEWFQSLDFCNPKFHLEWWGRFSTKMGYWFFSTLGGKPPPPRFLKCFDDSAETKDGRGFFLDPAITPDQNVVKNHQIVGR